MRYAVFSLALMACLACSTPPVKSRQELDHGPFELMALHVRSRMLLSLDCSAGAAMVIRRGETVYEEYFGREGAKPESSPVGPDSRFPFYSVSKGFCSALVLSMVSDGLIGLDDPVVKYMPYFTGTGPGGSFPRERVTVRMLAAHSGGVPRDDTPPRTWDGGENPFGDVILESEPGTQFLYSELGMRLLGHLLSIAGGKPYEDLLRERVLEPLGLSSIGWLNRGDNRTHAVETCWGPDSSYLALSDEFAPRPYPGSGLYGSVRDIGRYARLFLEGGLADGKRIFNPELIEAAWVNQPPGRMPDPQYGLLFWLFPRQGAAVFSGMAHTICCILPEREMILVMGLNQGRGGGGWDFEVEKQNLARVGMALDELLIWRESGGLAGERARER